MEVGKLEKYAKTAFKKELRVLRELERYYKGECSLGYASKQAGIPLRALMDFMQKYELPYFWDSRDSKEGLKRLSEIRAAL